MKRTLLTVVFLGLLLVAACASPTPKANNDATGDQGVANDASVDAAVDTLGANLTAIDSLDAELNFSELDALDEELNFG